VEVAVLGLARRNLGAGFESLDALRSASASSADATDAASAAISPSTSRAASSLERSRACIAGGALAAPGAT
jgi:hypothetical protein